LCAVLDERRDGFPHEQTVDALLSSGDPAAVPTLRRVITWIPDWDPYGQMARKAVWGLQLIGTPDALAAIREEVTPDLPLYVVEAAAKALDADRGGAQD
jgi:hypothetical protein